MASSQQRELTSHFLVDARRDRYSAIKRRMRALARNTRKRVSVARTQRHAFSASEFTGAPTMIAEHGSFTVDARNRSRAARVIGKLGYLLLASVWGLTASAQTAPPSEAAAPVIEEVVVTGSRIASPNATSASPIQVISTQEITATGKNDISDVINQLPQIFNNDLGQDFSNRTSGLTSAGGVATADLRGLGPNRTLVLIDGRRLGQGSPYTFIQSPAPDLDQIPLFMVERVEVVTGGASAVYGSDAIA